MKKIKFSLLLLSCIAGLSLHAQVKEFSKPTDQYFEISKNLEIISNIFKELNNNYVDPINPGEMTKNAIDVMLYQLDPYTNFMTETDKEDYEFQTMGKYAGIGTSIEIIDSNVYIGEIFENSPLHKAGVHPGDQLISIDEVHVTGKTMDEISLLLRGAAGTNVKLELKPYNTSANITKDIKRENIDIKSVPYYTLIGKNKDIAYVYLTQFTNDCSKEVANALAALKEQQPALKGVVLDLRNNPGGLLHEAVNICNLFIPKGQLVVSTKGKNKSTDMNYTTKNEPWDVNIALTVLINSGSASASEVVAGTLQDLDRAVVVGMKSFGKGLVQIVKPLGYNTSLKMTVSKYYTPSGRCIQAIDYSNRNPDGSIATVPDSLRKSFKTKLGRTVYDGGGIEPDKATKSKEVNRAMISLFEDGHIFKFVTEYAHKHNSIAPAETFIISDNDYNDFVQWLEKRQYSYESKTEETIKKLEQSMKDEHYYDDNKALLESIKTKIAADKKNILNQNKDLLKLIISNEIVGRYYYQKGKVIHRLFQNDQDLLTAIDILENIETSYLPIIRPK